MRLAKFQVARKSTTANTGLGHLSGQTMPLKVTGRSEAVVAVGKLGWDLAAADQN
jgi:hypothetical protein